MLKIGILVSGGGTNLQAIIDSIENGKIRNAEIVTVVASKPGVYALERAKNHNIPSIVISRKSFNSVEEFDAALCDHLMTREVDLVVMAGFLSIVGDNLLKNFKNRIINIHPSLIPAFCGNGFYGLKVHEAALERGVKITGATVHFVNEITDGGPILLQKAVEVQKYDTAEILQKRVMEEAEWIILPKAIDMIANGEI